MGMNKTQNPGREKFFAFARHKKRAKTRRLG